MTPVQPPRDRRPRGPRTVPTRPSAATYRRRRLAALAILFAVVVVVALIIHTIGGLMSAARDASKQAAAQTTTPTTDAVTPCTSANVAAYVTPDAATIKPGWKLTNAVKLEIKGAGKGACSLSSAPKRLGLRVSHGSDVVYDSTRSGCYDKEATGKKLLLGRDIDWETQFVWDAHVHDDSCSPSEPAEPGVYALTVVLDGKPIGQPAQVTIEGEGNEKPRDKTH